VERLKKNPYGDSETGQTLLESMNQLTSSINRLLSVLETANEEMIRDYETDRESERLDKIESQNEKIAEALVSVAKMLKEGGGTPEFAPLPQQSVAPTPTSNPFEHVRREESKELPSVAHMPKPPKNINLDDVPSPPQ